MSATQGEAPITLAVSDWSPAGLPLYAKFRMWDDNDGANGFNGNSPKTSSYNNEVVSVGSLIDGHQYGWTANATDDTLTSAESPWCYFRVDKTAPAVAVGSTDFPPSGTPNTTPAKYATDAGTFTISGSDPAPASGLNASGLACFRVSTSSTPVTGWHCGDAGTVMADANGKASYSYTPGLWGTNILYVQAQDNAGNYSQPSAYSYYAPWKPGTLPVFGDLTGDQKPDLVLPDANGNLRLINTSNDPANANPIAGAGATSPTGTWNGVQITHRASLLAGKPVDDLIAHPAGDPRLYLYANDGHGNFVTRTAFYKSGTTINSAVTCQDIDGATIPCPADFGTDWTNATQILAVGTPEGENAAKDANNNYVLTRTSILAVINHQLWLFPPGTSSARLLKPTDTQVSTADWTNYDLIGPGPANGGNQPTLWARDRVNGTVHAYPITTKSGGGVDFGALTDPTTGTVAGTGGFDPATYPTVGSNGDLNSDGVADLWAKANDGRLVVWPGTADTNGKVTGFAASRTLGDLRTPSARWQLNEAAGATTAADTAGQHPGTVKPGVSFAPATVDGRTVNAATFNGTTGEIDTTGTSIDSTKSFTVSVWANPAQGGGPVLSQDGTSTSGFILWPEASDGTWRFGMSTADDTNWSYDQTAIGMTGAARFQAGRWDRLTASYNAAGGQIQLYVNGVLAGSGFHTSKSGITGPVVLGRYKYQGAPTSWFKGSASDVVAYNYPTDPWSSTTGQIALTGFAGKCMDVNGGATAAGTAVQVWDCAGVPAQRWTVNANGTLSNNGMCLDATGGGTANGTVMEIWNCGSNPVWPNQVFIPLANGSIYNPVSGRCVDVPNADTTNGIRLALYDCNRTPAQVWSVSRG
ncbi:ricin-type beta-trefoil lectin domain protein [Kitasatospora sp. NBC_01539]|uniref:ricin-type beta-trefoil lectin domain protein n=1 Tax=Kitasatospora sp. NBC_01539 TaxID=2903577 RepID=UPI00386031AD